MNRQRLALFVLLTLDSIYGAEDEAARTCSTMERSGSISWTLNSMNHALQAP